MLQDNKQIYALPFFIELPNLTKGSANEGMNTLRSKVAVMINLGGQLIWSGINQDALVRVHLEGYFLEGLNEGGKYSA